MSQFTQDPELTEAPSSDHSTARPNVVARPDRGSGPRSAPAASAEPIDWEALEPRSWYGRHGRRLLDLALLGAILPLAFVPAVLVALANWIQFGDPRRILFVQERVGWRGRTFSIYKFRTMREASAGAMDSWSNGEDRLRVTRLGRFLRSSHLDELPQLLNILLGDMRLIGPRPEMVEIEAWAAEHVPGFSRRLALRPGLTGLAQIVQGYAGRDVNAYRTKLELNDQYREQLSFRLDLVILCRTVLWILRGKGWDWKQQARAASAPLSD